MTVDTRKELLADASEIVSIDRNTTYGEPEDSFAAISDLWASYLRVPVTSADVANMMVLMKVARLKTNPSHRDSWVDIAGYAACGWSAVEASQ